METAHGPSRRNYGKEMSPVVPFAHLAFSANHVDAIFYTFGTASRERLAGYERLAGTGCRSRGKKSTRDGRRGACYLALKRGPLPPPLVVPVKRMV